MSFNAARDLPANQKATNNKTVGVLRDKYPIDSHTYEQQQNLILQDINDKILEQESKLQKLPPINYGDWVTINKEYAKDHGASALDGNYKIISKKVKASDLFTNGDSIHEFGYDPENSQLVNALRSK